MRENTPLVLKGNERKEQLAASGAIHWHPCSWFQRHCQGAVVSKESPSCKRYTDNTITDINLLESQLERIAVTEVGEISEEFQVGVIGVAVLVRDVKGRMIASLALHVPVARLPMNRAMECLPSLQRAAAAMTVTFAAK